MKSPLYFFAYLYHLFFRMKISYNWLKTLIDIDVEPVLMGEMLTDAGLEVESIETFESIRGGLKGLVVGEVVECAKHPDADRLSITKVNVGEKDLLNIVCGAPNVAAGQKVIVATIGTTLYPVQGEPFEIKKSKIRGAASEGMICAEDEIGLGSSHAGIMVLPPDTKAGTPASEFFKISTDHIFEIGLTPNRSDAASHLGVARDLSAIFNSRGNHVKSAALPQVKGLPAASGTSTVKVEIRNHEGCKRYTGIVVSGIKVAPSPEWLSNRLRSIGVRPINNIVDITNFVLHETGQPLHAFDLEQIKGSEIIVRNAKEGEPFKTLDGIERKLKADDLIIADSQKPMCIAGVFGGAESGVSEKTTSLFIESAYFDPAHVRRSSKHHGLKTDASFRFERGTDPEMTLTALQRAASLVLELAGGVISMEAVDLYPEKLAPYKVAFSFHNCRELIGKDIDRQTIRNIITSLGIQIETEGNDGLLLSVPLYKTDVTREADVIEEVMRIYGYNNVEESKSISYTASAQPRNWDVALTGRITESLTGAGFSEMMGLSLTNDQFYSSSHDLVKVLNPLSSDLNVLRGDLLFGGLQALSHNINRKTADLKLFEIGRIYRQAEGTYQEEKQLSVFVTGNLFNDNPYGLNQSDGFSYLKGSLENLFTRCGVSRFTTSESGYENFEAGFTFTLNGKPLAEIGKVRNTVLKKFDINQPVYYANIKWNVLQKAFSKQHIEYKELVKFPAVRRDLALLIDRSVKYDDIVSLAHNTEKKFLQEVNLFDIYQGEKLGNKKSYAVSFTLQNSEATLTDKQIEGVMDKLVTTYKQKLGAELR
jgi:phenylalanyl-tRNA synthetase beta chain